MRLNQFSEIGFRVLIHLGSDKSCEAITVAEISDMYGISHHHVAKVVGALVKLDLVKTHRGRKGGIQLVPSALYVCVGEILHSLESYRPYNRLQVKPRRLESKTQFHVILEIGVKARYAAMNQFILRDLLGSAVDFTKTSTLPLLHQ